MSNKWIETVIKLSCIIPGAINAVRHNIREHAQSAYARRCFHGVQFEPLAYAMSNCEFEAPCRINGRSKLVNVKMGRHSYCGEGCFFAYSEIGRFCSIGNEVIIGTWLHPTQLVSTFPGFYHSSKYTINLHRNDEIKTFAETTIGNDVWIGHRAIVLGGITIGDGAIIGAGAVVTKDVEAYAIVAGVPARMIRKRFQKHIVDRLLELRWWNYDDDILRRYSDLFGDPDVFIERFGK